MIRTSGSMEAAHAKWSFGRLNQRPNPALPVCLLLVLTSIGGSAADVQPPLEYEVKAAFLLNFTRFIEWPPAAFAAADGPFSICVLGDDPFGRALDRTVEGESVNGRKIEIQRIVRQTPASCQIVFAGGSEKDLPKVLAGMGPGVLTVGEGARFLREGGMIAFMLENRRVRFDINQSAAAKAGLRISSKLLSVARSVEK
jgi:hypothetical protein